jgi:hypothetical protein
MQSILVARAYARVFLMRACKLADDIVQKRYIVYEAAVH